MVDFSESLTIHIRGDSSEFLAELDEVGNRINSLEARLATFDSIGQRLGGVLDRIGQMTQPLDRVSSAIARVAQQLQNLSAQPVTLNVQPALAALQQLQTQIAATLAQLIALRSLSAGGSFGGSGSLGLAGFAQGGLVVGRPGWDRVPALLTAGEFVIREPVVQDVGPSFLGALNEFGRTSLSRSSATSAPAESAPTTNVTHFGGISIHMQQASDVDGIVRNLESASVRLKNRRG